MGFETAEEREEYRRVMARAVHEAVEAAYKDAAKMGYKSRVWIVFRTGMSEGFVPERDEIVGVFGSLALAERELEAQIAQDKHQWFTHSIVCHDVQRELNLPSVHRSIT